MIKISDLVLGAEAASSTIHFTRDNLVRYAGASLDFNPIHYRDDVAESVGLPGVLAHGMLTMGAAVSVVTSWLAGSAVVIDYQTRFTKPVVVDPVSGADLEVSVAVGEIKPDEKTVRFDIKVVCDGQTVLGKAQAIARFKE